MNTLKTLFSSAFIAALSVAGSANADQLMDIIHPESADLFDHATTISASGDNKIVSLNDTTSQEVWSYEYEQYVNPADFAKASYADINQYLEANPTAAGSQREEVFKLHEPDGDYHLN